MPWCPKCKNEYIEGITTCIDCGVDLVDELPKETDPGAPVILCRLDTEETAKKFLTYLRYGGLETVTVRPAEDRETGADLIIAAFEQDAAINMFAQLDTVEEDITEINFSDLLPSVEKKLAELEAEEASHMFSDLRTEASSVYVKKKDKYTDLKFSGISFLVFGIIGAAFVIANQLEFINFFNEFSVLIMAVVFVIFIIVGIRSLIRARKLKNIVSEEEKVTNEVKSWIDTNINDEVIADLVDPELSEEDNYFAVHEKLCNMVMEQFPFFNRAYAEELMDEQYNNYCEHN